MQAMEISRTALDVEWRRLEIIAQNLANANTANPLNGVGYSAQNLISGPRTDFAALLDGDKPGAGIALESLSGVRAYGIDASLAPARLVSEPGNPQANAQGYVSYPSIDMAEQMTTMVRTSRSYEANIVAMSAARQMYSKALELGRRS